MNSTEADYIHQSRRKALLTWFTTQKFAENAPTVQVMVDRLHDRLVASSGKVVNLSDAYRSLAIDVATSFAFQKAFGNLDEESFSKDFNEAVRRYGRFGILNRYLFGLPLAFQTSLPAVLANKISPAVSSFMKVCRC